MTSGDRHMDVGAYVLGALSDAEATRFEEHLVECEQCAEELDRLMGVESVLAEFAAATPAGQSAAEMLAPPPPRLLDRLVDQVRATRRTARRRRLYLAAAAAALIVAGPTATAVVEAQQTSAPPAVSATATAANHSSGVHATVAMTDKPWGTQVGLTLGGVNGPLQCDLVAVSTTGAKQTVATWAVPGAGYGVSDHPKPLVVQGGTGLSRTQIDYFMVRSLDGRTLVTVKA